MDSGPRTERGWRMCAKRPAHSITITDVHHYVMTIVPPLRGIFILSPSLHKLRLRYNLFCIM